MGCVVKAWWCGPAVDSESDGGGGGKDGCEGCGEGCGVGEGSEGVGTGCEDGLSQPSPPPHTVPLSW